MQIHIKSIAEKPPRYYPWNSTGDVSKTIGVVDPCYGSSHVIYGLGTQKYIHRWVPKIPLQKLDRKATFFRFTPFILNKSLPLIHTWNALPLNRDFIVSFELEIPRYLGKPSKSQILRGMRILSSDRCKRILALSDFAYQSACRHFDKFGFSELEEKMSIFRGAVSPSFEEMGSQARPQRASFEDKPLSAVVIGTQLFRKGGMHAIMAFEQLHKEGLNVRLTLIGDFETESYAYRHAIPDAKAWRQRAKSHDWLRFIGPVPNNRVVEELLAHDICIYSSLDESLGWLPIEAGMLGVPVIATGVCAFPELVIDGETGWLVSLPLGKTGRWAGIEASGTKKEAFVEDANVAISDGIAHACRKVLDNPTVLSELGQNARARMSRLYGTEPARRKLEAIYDDVLK